MKCIRRLRPLLGTFVEIGAAPSLRAADAIDAAYAAVESVQRALSFHDPRSELSRLNQARCGEQVTLSAQSLRVLRLARAMTRLSGGLFNCTLGGAMVRRGLLPDHGGPAPLEAGDAEDLLLDARGARLRRPVRITLDGLAKGYAVDCAVAVLGRRGVAAGYVNAGGDLRVFGSLTLPVAQRQLDGSLRPLGGLHKGAMATSAHGNDADPSFPGTILPADGAQLPQGVWSVLARFAWRADALTKVAALLPPKRRDAELNRLGGRWIGPVAA